MGKFNNLRSKIAEDFEIPSEAITDYFDLKMQGNKKVIIENHLGITVYENDEVGVKTIDNTILIKGSKFKIEEINNYNVIIKGNIDEIIFSKKE